VLNSAAVSQTDPDGIQFFKGTYEYLAVLPQQQAMKLISSSGLVTSATRGFVRAAADIPTLMNLQREYGRHIGHLPQAWIDNYIDYQVHIYELYEVFGGTPALLDYDREVRSVLQELSQSMGPSKAPDFGIFKQSHAENRRLFKAYRALDRPQPPPVVPRAAPAAPSRFITPPPASGGAGGAPSGAGGAPPAPQQSRASDYACVMTPAGTPVFDLTKFKAGKSCFRYQMTGVVCAHGACPMVNGMVSAVPADRDAAHAVVHAAVCSYCSMAGHVGGCHASADWLEANVALASFRYP
jgi:hypothetical protein